MVKSKIFIKLQSVHRIPHSFLITDRVKSHTMKRVVVGMSGGVDSSVTAHLLKEKGYEVIGLFMRNWEDIDGACPAVVDEEDVAQVCHKLDIPFYTVNFTKEYWDLVFTEFLEGLKKGVTPNPDILCNQKIKFDHFYKKARDLGADFLATGHYARTNEEGELLRAADENKDQTYFLYTVKKEVLKHVLFPLGDLQKSEVREIARKANLPVAEKKDSTGICFIGKRDFRTFMKEYLPMKPGKIVDLDGKTLGNHEGAFFYTIGQRKGLGIGGPGDPWFVIGKNIDKNHVIVAQGHAHPSLLSNHLTFGDITWVDDMPPEKCTAKVRYRTPDVSCTFQGKSALFDPAVWAATPGQSIVFYDKEKCLGGGIIEKASQISHALV
ncbi:MAG: tRNA 2-thiouridine(34) synthase MnmA [Simkaniaceae bacterium]|nr:tRNA 2-thiouridine(34) synthase MnmA [Simkaniaceae bacterium]